MRKATNVDKIPAIERREAIDVEMNVDKHSVLPGRCNVRPWIQNIYQYSENAKREEVDDVLEIRKIRKARSILI